MKHEFKKITSKNETRYVLDEFATGSSTSAASVGSGSVVKSLGGVQHRQGNLLAQEADTVKVPVKQKPRQGALRTQTGAGAHRDKKKEQKQGKEKHRKPYMEDHEIQMASSELQAIAKSAVHLLDLIKKYSEAEGLEAWQQSKITKAADYLNSVLQSISGEQSNVSEVAPKGWEGTVKAMKKHKDIDNPWALAHWMKNKGYTSHKKEEGVAEGNMPSSVIKHKQKIASMSDKEFADSHKEKSDDDLRAMAWRHGHGQGSNHYVEKRRRGRQGVAEAMTPQQQHDFDRMRAGAMSRKEYDAKWKKPRKSDDEVIYGKRKSVAEGAYNDGVADGIQGRRNPRASSIYGPSANDYDAGYAAGVEQGKEKQQARVAQSQADKAPYENLSTDELKQMRADIQKRSNERQAIYNKIPSSTTGIHPSRLPKNHEEMMSQNKADNKAWHIINQVLWDRGEKVDEDDGISKNKETEFHSKLDKLVHNTFGKRKDEVEEDSYFESLFKQLEERTKK